MFSERAGSDTTAMTDLLTLAIFKEDISPEQSWRLVAWCMANGADEFTIDGITSEGASITIFEEFDKVVGAYRRPSALRRHLSAPTADELVRLTELWTLNQTSLAALERALPDGLFTYNFGLESWFEDLVLYRQGELVLGVITHESEGVLRVTPLQRADLDCSGIRYRLENVWVEY
jgi:hypothetical protein